uniref:Uncharacterized protein n=1 Tax=Callorhinchus milii TaxID=7868 RepID=A0A4W3H2M5_CALMI
MFVCNSASTQLDLPPYCEDPEDNTRYEDGTSWTNCINPVFIASISFFFAPRVFMPAFYPEDCVSVLDQLSCQYQVYKKDNPSEKCFVYSYIGK